MISGAYVPMLTAFDQAGHLDTGAYAAFAQWLAGRGVDGLVPFGTTGEGASLSLRERLAEYDQRQREAALQESMPRFFDQSDSPPTKT